jgi:DNA oxidative demethylase
VKWHGRRSRNGLVYRQELLTVAEERNVLGVLETLRFDTTTSRGRRSRGRSCRRGCRSCATASPHSTGEYVEARVRRYPAGSTIGWHRDAPAFGDVVGVSLLGSARLRFQRGKGEARRVWEVLCEPRSVYVLAGPARTSWQHSIPPTKELRYSITFRTLRRQRATA